MISNPGPWSCRIYLRFEYDGLGRPLKEVLRIPFGPPLEDPDDVELVLRRAQAAILNPNEESTSFLDKTRQELDYYKTAPAFSSGTLKFSKNVVSVDIFDAACADLSFVDLPGELHKSSFR